MRYELRKKLETLIQKWLENGASVRHMAEGVMLQLDAAGWGPEATTVARPMRPLTRPGDTFDFYVGSPGHGGVALADGDTLEAIVAGELVQGTLRLYPTRAALELTIEVDRIAVERRLASGQCVDGGDSYELPLPDCALVRKVEV